jgi:hypothetical protein
LPTGSFYHSFGSTEEFHTELLRWLSQGDASPEVSADLEGSLQDLAAWVKETTPDGPAMSGAIAQLIGEHVANFRAKAAASFRLQLLLSAVVQTAEEDDGPEDEDDFTRAFRETYGQMYRHVEQHDSAGYQAFLDALDMRLRTPFSVESVTAVLVALFDGLALRSILLPDSDVTTLLEDTLRVIMSSLLCSVDDQEDYDIDQLVADTLNGNVRASPARLEAVRSA